MIKFIGRRLKRLLLLGAIVGGGYYAFSGSDDEGNKDGIGGKKDKGHTYWKDNTLVVDVSDTQTTVIPAGDPRLKKIKQSRIDYSKVTKTPSIALALSKTIDKTATVKPVWKRKSLTTPENTSKFCADTKNTLTKMFQGTINGFECDHLQVTVATKWGVTNYAAKNNRSITMK